MMVDGDAKQNIDAELMDIRNANENDIAVLRELFEKSRLRRTIILYIIIYIYNI